MCKTVVRSKEIGVRSINSILLIFLLPVFSFSQQLETVEVDTPILEPLDMETVQAELDFLKEKYRKDYAPLIAMDNHFTAFFGQNTNFWGLKVGLEFKQKYRMGFGGYYMPKKVAMTPVLETGAIDSTYRKFRMHYYTAFFEWVFIKNFRWELAMPVSLGYGRAEVERWEIVRRGDTEISRGWVPGKDINEFVATWSVNAHYKIFSWVGVGLGLGWRQIVTPNEQIQQGFSGVILSYKVKLFPGHLYKSLFKREKILEEKGDYRWRKFMKKNLKRLKREEARRLKGMK